jgi:DNA polymerase III epsilon subunit-like protein
MIDLETLGTSPRAAVVAIGACTFDDPPGVERSTLYLAVDPASSQAQGGEVDARTAVWWMRQSPEAVRSTFPEEGAASIGGALLQLVTWVRELGEDVEIWGNPSTFDVVVLEEALRRSQLHLPWNHRAHRCYRTLRHLSDLPRPEPELAHNALSDALAQARHAEAILRALRGETT